MSENTIQRALRVARHEGWPGVWTRCLGMLGYRRLLLLRRSLEGPLTECPASVPLIIEWLRLDEEADYRTLVPDYRSGTIGRRIQSGDRCLTARVDGKLVAVMWVSTGHARIAYLKWDMPLQRGEVYLSGAFTDPAWRGHSIAPALSMEMLRRCQGEGAGCAIRGTLPGNKPALRAHAKAGFVLYAKVGCISLGPWRHEFRREVGAVDLSTGLVDQTSR